MGIDHEKLKQARAGARSGGGWKPQAGPNRVFVLPPHSRYLDRWEDLENLAIPYKMHYFKIEGRPTEASRCLSELKQRCPACDTWRMFRKSEDPALKEMAKQVSPSDQYLFNMLDINNLQAGIQKWAANWTCWDKIMEIAANAAWGDVCDPANGVIFVVTMTPKGQTRSGYNSYTAPPEPQRVTMMETLNAIENWRSTLDELEGSIGVPKEAVEISTLLNEIGFPSTERPASATAPPSPAPGAAAPSNPAPGAATPPSPAPAAASPAVAVPGPTAVGAVPGPAAPAGPAAPVVVAPAAPPAVVPAAATGAPPATTAAEVNTIHYDPGPNYAPKIADAERPANAPKCFTDYDPRIHQCAPCPAATDCQLKMLGVDD